MCWPLLVPLSILRGYTEGLQDGRLQGAPNLYTIMHGEVEHLQWLVEASCISFQPPMRRGTRYALIPADTT